MLDANGNGKVERKEVQTKQGQGQRDAYEQMSNIFGVDDGCVSREEYVAHMGKTAPDGAIAVAAFLLRDLDGDGCLDFEEAVLEDAAVMLQAQQKCGVRMLTEVLVHGPRWRAMERADWLRERTLREQIQRAVGGDLFGVWLRKRRRRALRVLEGEKRVLRAEEERLLRRRLEKLEVLEADLRARALQVTTTSTTVSVTLAATAAPKPTLTEQIEYLQTSAMFATMDNEELAALAPVLGQNKDEFGAQLQQLANVVANATCVEYKLGQHTGLG